MGLGCIWISRQLGSEREPCEQRAGCRHSVMVRGSLPFMEDELPEQSRALVLETLVLTVKQHMDSGSRNNKTSGSKTRSMEIAMKSMGCGI